MAGSCMPPANKQPVVHFSQTQASRYAEARARAGPRVTRGSPEPCADIGASALAGAGAGARVQKNEKYFENEPGHTGFLRAP